MENIALGIANIDIEQNFDEIFAQEDDDTDSDYYSGPRFKFDLKKTAFPRIPRADFHFGGSRRNAEDAAARLNDGAGASGGSADSSYETIALEDKGELEGQVAAQSSDDGSSSWQRRKMPSRASKETSMSKTKRRTIMKPAKRNAAKTSSSCDFSALRASDIRKIYLKQKLTKFKPSNLETIFEEPQSSPVVAARRAAAAAAAAIDEDEDPDGIGSQVKLVGVRKMRRSLCCSDGLNANKTLVKQRRAKIKKTFGRRCAPKKISLDQFLERLNKSFEPDDGAMDADVGALAEADNLKTDEGTATAGVAAGDEGLD